ncbi:MAG: tetratricopeptide repeat protein, partial [Azoarcus sp.]|nr:tetratricopeptide repeat protein [Azoarcus sp.]
MQTVPNDFVPPRATGAGFRPFRTIALSTCLALAISACETASTTPGPRDDRQTTTHTRPEPRDVGQPTTPTTPPSTRDETTPLHGDGTDPALRRQYVTAMFRQAADQAKQGNLSAAIPIYRDIERTYSDGDDKAMGAWAIFYQGDLQRQLRNHKAAAAAYERLDQRFGRETDPAVRTVVADALLKKGEALTEQGDIRAAIAAYDEV